MPRLSWNRFLTAFILLFVCVQAAGAGQAVWDMDSLRKTPSVYPAPQIEPAGDKALYFDSLLTTPEMREKGRDADVTTLLFTGPAYEGKSTHVFAFYGRPRVPIGTKVPAVVLVHGGGGTAFESWVRLWNARGYAAIAIDTCGTLPDGSYGDWKRNEYGGPPCSSAFSGINLPIQDQWTYHAVADIILANSLIRSFDEIDPERVGITGISWGGYLTCIAASVDNRFKFAVPVYGCGFLNEDSAWTSTLAKIGPEKAEQWTNLWDPSRYLPGCRVPMLWVSGTNDIFYPMGSLAKSYRLTKGKRTICLRIEMRHGHGGIGETAEEIFAFADSICKGGDPLLKIIKLGRKDGGVWASFKSETAVAKAELCFTADNCEWKKRKWQTAPASVEDKKVSSTLPPDASAYYFNIYDERGLIVSTEHVEIKVSKPEK